jgi:flagellar basal body-associated protein FliL
MFKKQHKWIALLVTLTFAWMLQVSTMPLAAASTTEQASSANAEQGQNFVEVMDHETAPAKSKSILPLILIGVGVVAIAAVLFLVVLKTKYDIVGTWTVVWHWTSGSTYGDTATFTFSGTMDSGTVSDSYGDTGTDTFKL